MLYTLQAQLYQNFYSQGGLPADRMETVKASVPAHTFMFTQELSAANCGHGSWEAGWEVRALTDEQVLLAAQWPGFMPALSEPDGGIGAIGGPWKHAAPAHAKRIS